MQKIKTIDVLFYKKLGKIIYNSRSEQNITQQELAKAVGVSRTLITGYENGNVKIKPTVWEQICKYLKIPSNIKIKINFEQNQHRRC